jgi:ribosomal protein S18 acetylase RimI-like enzyme
VSIWAGCGWPLKPEVPAWVCNCPTRCWRGRGTLARAVDLWVTCGNEAALSLYRRAGFSPVGEHKPLPSDASHEIERMVLILRGRPA